LPQSRWVFGNLDRSYHLYDGESALKKMCTSGESKKFGRGWQAHGRETAGRTRVTHPALLIQLLALLLLPAATSLAAERRNPGNTCPSHVQRPALDPRESAPWPTAILARRRHLREVTFTREPGRPRSGRVAATHLACSCRPLDFFRNRENCHQCFLSTTFLVGRKTAYWGTPSPVKGRALTPWNWAISFCICICISCCFFSISYC